MAAKIEKTKEKGSESERKVATLPEVAEQKSDEVLSVQSDINQEAEQQVVDKREQTNEEAVAALARTKDALKALDEKDVKSALDILEDVTGKLELLVARHPELSLAPVDVRTRVHDLFASPDSIEDLVDDAIYALKHHEVQVARTLLMGLASEIVVTTTSLPLATYPEAIKAIAPMLEDESRIDEAKSALQAALSTLVETHDVISLPVMRARFLLKKAEELTENEDRSEEEKGELKNYLAEARNQLEMAELLGYGRKSDFKPIYDQIKQIRQKTDDGGSGTGWFDRIKQQVSDLF